MIVASFRVKPDPDRTFYFRVEIYDSVRAMRSLPKPVCGTTSGVSRILAGCFGYTRLRVSPGGAMKMLPELGTIRFAKSHLGVGVVSHEVFHAVCRYLQRIGKGVPVPAGEGSEWVGEDEEVACRAQQNMVQAIYSRIYDLRSLTATKG